MIDQPDIADNFALLILMGSFLFVILIAGLFMEWHTKRKARKAAKCRHINIYMDADNYVRCKDCQTSSNDFEI